MSKRWVLAFLAAYGAHVAAMFAHAGRIEVGLPAGAAQGIALLSLLAILGLVVAQLATRDEFERRMALIAAAISALTVGALSYGLKLAAHIPQSGFVAENLWAAAIAAWLVAYGAMRWRARS